MSDRHAALEEHLFGDVEHPEPFGLRPLTEADLGGNFPDISTTRAHEVESLRDRFEILLEEERSADGTVCLDERF